MKKIQLGQLDSILKGDNDFVAKINAISNTLKELLSAQRCTIFIHDKDTHSFWTAHIEGMSYIELPDDKGIVSEVFEKKAMLIVNDVQNHPHFHNKIDQASGFETHCMLAVAILNHRKEPIGVVQLINKTNQESGFSPKDKQVLQTLVHYISQFTEQFNR